MICTRHFIPSLFILMLLLQSCSDGVEHSELTDGVELKFALQTDSIYRYTVTNNIVLTQRLDEENKITINQNMMLMSSYHILSTNKSSKTVSVTYEQITMSSGNQLFSLDYDSETDDGVDPMYEGLRRLIDKNHKIEISDKGEIISSDPAQVDTTLSGNIYGINDSSIRRIMLHCLEVYPQQNVHIGDIWERSYSSSVGFVNVRIRNKYQLVSIKHGVATIELQGRVNSGSLSQTQGDKVSLKGIESGSFDVEIATGLVKNASISQKLSGNMNITGKDAPVEVESQIFIMGITKPQTVQ